MGAGDAAAASGSAGVALGDKSLLELSVASRAAAAGSAGPTDPSAMGGAGNNYLMGGMGASSSTTYEAEASAHCLLAREGYGFDSARLGRTARDLERRATVNTAASVAAGGFGRRMEEEKKDGVEPSFGGGWWWKVCIGCCCSRCALGGR